MRPRAADQVEARNFGQSLATRVEPVPQTRPEWEPLEGQGVRAKSL